MGTTGSNLGFRLMSLSFMFRDMLNPREEVLSEVPIEPGCSVLDYGCGPGSYTIAAARLVGEAGKTYAVDIHPLAIRYVQNRAARQGLTNVATILSGCETGLPDESIDIVLLYDTLHTLSEPGRVLAELHRVLKPGGILSFNDHHLKEENEVIARVTQGGLFRLSGKGKKVYNFVKAAH